MAVEQNRMNNTIILLDAGACIDCADSNDNTPLMEAVFKNFTVILKVVLISFFGQPIRKYNSYLPWVISMLFIEGSFIPVPYTGSLFSSESICI